MENKLLFNVNEITLVDINRLIDKGKRFNVSNDDSLEYDSVKEYLDETVV